MVTAMVGLMEWEVLVRENGYADDYYDYESGCESGRGRGRDGDCDDDRDRDRDGRGRGLHGNGRGRGVHVQMPSYQPN